VNIVRNAIAQVSIETGIAPESIRHRSYRGHRTKMPVVARWRVWKRLRDLGWSYPRIAMAFDGLHHTTILHGVRRLDEIEGEARRARCAEADALFAVSASGRQFVDHGMVGA